MILKFPIFHPINITYFYLEDKVGENNEIDVDFEVFDGKGTFSTKFGRFVNTTWDFFDLALRNHNGDVQSALSKVHWTFKELRKKQW